MKARDKRKRRAARLERKRWKANDLAFFAHDPNMVRILADLYESGHTSKLAMVQRARGTRPNYRARMKLRRIVARVRSSMQVWFAWHLEAHLYRGGPAGEAAPAKARG